MLQMTPFRSLPGDVAARASALVADIGAGRTRVFSGPIDDQSRARKIAAGAAMDDGALASMRWLADGVDGTLG